MLKDIHEFTRKFQKVFMLKIFMSLLESSVKVHLTGNSDLKEKIGCKTFFRLF